MNNLSDEQQYILNQVKEGKNVIVDAVAGSGKSTTVLSIARELPNKKILQLTYNSSLRTEIKEKVKHFELTNLTIHTYHSLAVRHYLTTSYTDTGIRYILCNNIPAREPIPYYDIIVIDEAQDMSLVYFQLVRKFIKDMCLHRGLREPETNHTTLPILNEQSNASIPLISTSNAGDLNVQLCKIQFVILGDVMQGLYEFKGSDIRFLSLADKIWASNPFLLTTEMVKCNMRMSYRITNQIKQFVNNTMLGEERMDSCRDGEPVKYIRNSRSNLEKTVIYEINCLLEQGVKPSEIFVLGASVKGANSNVRKMENALVNQGIPCFVPMLEMADKIDDRVIDGKVVFSTFHCVKGRQRAYVFIVGFDNGYLDYYARNLPKDRCPNTLYVGATRATKGLYLLENDQYATDRPLEFLKQSHHEMKNTPYIRFKGIPRSIFYMKEEVLDKNNILQEKHYTTPTDMIKFIPDHVIDQIFSLLDKIFIREPTETFEVDIPTIIQTQQGYYEEVSDINGIAIPSMYYDFIIGEQSNVLYDMISENMKETKENQHGFLKTLFNELPRTSTNISDYLYLSNLYLSCQEKLYFKLKQIHRNEYNWISEETMDKCRELLKNTIGKESEKTKPTMESTIIQSSDDKAHQKIDEFLSQHFPIWEKFRFTARVDLITEITVWELKCTTKISIDHLLQVVIYAWLWNMTNPDVKKYFKILNIKTGEIQVLDATLEELNFIIVAILKGKFSKLNPLTDDEFIASTFE